MVCLLCESFDLQNCFLQNCWMENVTTLTPLKHPIVFVLDGFHFPPGYGSLLFVITLATCFVTLLGNGMVACTIIIDKSLHRPMFVMVCNMVVCDLLGSMAVLPYLTINFLTGENRIAYTAAIVQSFCVHTYVTAVHTVLVVMAYDRYSEKMSWTQTSSLIPLFQPYKLTENYQ